MSDTEMLAEPIIALNRVVPGITTLGPGRRLGIWVQGCGLACAGCASVDTWDRQAGFRLTPYDLAREIIAQIEQHSLTGITLTGGEPADQSSALALALDIVAAHPLGNDVDVLLFTGYSLPAARKRAAALFRCIDTVIAGPYRRELPSSEPLVASSNQQLQHLTERGAARHQAAPSRERIQLLAQNGELTLVGLPAHGDLDRFTDALEERGVRMGSVSWQA